MRLTENEFTRMLQGTQHEGRYGSGYSEGTKQAHRQAVRSRSRSPQSETDKFYGDVNKAAPLLGGLYVFNSLGKFGVLALLMVIPVVLAVGTIAIVGKTLLWLSNEFITDCRTTGGSGSNATKWEQRESRLLRR